MIKKEIHGSLYTNNNGTLAVTETKSNKFNKTKNNTTFSKNTKRKAWELKI